MALNPSPKMNSSAHSIRRALFLIASANYLDVAIAFVGVVIISRLLSPVEIGIFAIAAAFVSMMGALRDAGVSNYILQERHLDHIRIEEIKSVNFAAAMLLGTIMFCFADPLEAFFNGSGIGDVLRILAFSVPVMATQGMALALSRREHEYGIVAACTAIQASAQVGTTIVLAMLNFSYLSMAYGMLAGSLTSFVYVAVRRPQRIFIKPRMRFSRNLWGALGLNTGTSLVSALSSHAPDLIIGRLLGAGAVAFFSRGQTPHRLLQKILMATFGTIALPTYAMLIRQNMELRGMVLKSFNMLAGLLWPAQAFIALMAFPLVHLLFGDQWDSAVPLVQLMAFSSMLTLTGAITGQVMVAQSARRELLLKEMVVQFLGILFILAGAIHSLAAVAALQIIFRVVILPINKYFLTKYANITLSDLTRIFAINGMLSLITVVPSFIMQSVLPLPEDALLSRLLIAATVSACMWGLGLIILRHPLSDELIAILKRALSSK